MNLERPPSAVSILRSIVVINTTALLTFGTQALAGDTEVPSTTATCSRFIGEKVVDGKAVTRVVAQVEVLIRGDEARNAYAVGDVAADPIRLGGQEFATEKPSSRVGGFQWLSRWFKKTKQPADGLQIELRFDDIPPEAKKIELIQGTVQVLTGGDEKTLAIDGLSDRKPGPITSPVLQAAGLQASFYREEFPPRDLISVGIDLDVDDRKQFAGLRFVDASGRPRSDITPGCIIVGDTFKCGYSMKKADLTNARLLMLFREGAEIKTLPFKAENVVIE